MKNNEIKKLDMKSANIIHKNIEKIGQLFPHTLVDGKIDLNLLSQELSNEITDSKKEKYQLTWPGKREAIINANTSIHKTLLPIREKSVNFENTKNIYIEGENLDALKILQESYLRKVKVIYIDPPYNTGRNLIYKNNYTREKEKELMESGQIQDEGVKMLVNTDSKIGRASCRERG